MVKIQVLDSDGRYRGGLFNTEDFTRLNCLVWDGRPTPGCSEHLFMLPSGAWILYRRSATPILTGSRECNDLFDEASHAVRLTPAEARRWIELQGFAVPLALQSAVGLQGIGVSSIDEEHQAEDAAERGKRGVASRRRRGRPPQHDPVSDQRLHDDWKNSGMSQADFARTLGIEGADLVKAVDRHRQRQRRANPGAPDQGPEEMAP